MPNLHTVYTLNVDTNEITPYMKALSAALYQLANDNNYNSVLAKRLTDLAESVIELEEDVDFLEKYSDEMAERVEFLEGVIEENSEDWIMREVERYVDLHDD